MRLPQVNIFLFTILLQLAFVANCAGSASGLLPDTQGSLKTVVISVNSARRSTLRNAELVTNIVNSLPVATRVLILTNDRAAFTAAGNAWPERVSFIEMPAENPITMWTQDPFLVLNGSAESSGKTLLASRTFERSGDSAMAEHIAEYLEYQVQTSSLHFEGGNIVSDNDFIFIGANTIRRNALQMELSEAVIVTRFQEELGRPVLVIGPYPQPIAHIDMMITPLGDGRILLADSNEGARIAENAIQNNPESVEAFERYCEEHFFGHPAITEIHGKDGQVLSAPDVRGRTQQMVELSRVIGPVLDGIAASLERYGYEVERIPFLYGGPESLAGDNGDATSVAAYPMLTYNNALIAGQDVYLPSYGWAMLDEAARSTWETLGFTPHPIDGFTISAMYGGALRCSVKVLER